MSLTAWNKRLRAIENRPTAQKPLVITGGLPTGAEQLQAMSQAATHLRQPLCPALADPDADVIDSHRQGHETKGRGPRPRRRESVPTDRTV
jgi:hypothetical protein